MISQICIIFGLVGGFFFLMVGAIGMLRLPDVYTRMHAMGKCDTLGAGMILFATLFLVPDFTSGVKVILMGVLIATINPVMTHLIAKTAYDLDGARAPNTWVLDNYSPGWEERRG
jgi:multicomponent Na+:H+ antiporter subunit G